MRRVFVFVDIAGFTALTEAHGDLEAARLIKRFSRVMGELSTPNGRVVKMMGDGALVVFEDARKAVAFATALVDEVELMPGRPGVKIGMHLGEAVETGGDYVGHAVNVAARVAAQAGSCEVLITASVHDAIPEEDGFSWKSLGVRPLKNVTSETELFLLERETCTFDVDPVCRMRLTDREGISLTIDGDSFRFCSQAWVDAFARTRELATPPEHFESAKEE